MNKEPTLSSYEQALKKVTSEKTKEAYLSLQLRFDYGKRLVLPYKEGIAVLTAMSQAECIEDHYSSKRRIIPLPNDCIESSVLSYPEYIHHKMAALLNLTLDEVRAMAEAPKEQPP